MGIAFKTDTAKDITVGEQEQKTVNFIVGRYHFTCGVLEGTVTCETDAGKVVSGAIVKAVDQTDETKEYLGITDENGYFAICVPQGTYRLVVLCCPTGCCTGVACTCGCAG